jgi:hypothetical protein
MKRTTSIGLSALIALTPLAMFARTFDTSHLPYTDSPKDRATALAVSYLTEEGIIQGNADGTFRANSNLNRAEFITIVTRMLPATTVTINKPCFPDVPVGLWYTPAVCYAKSLGIVRGNAKPGVAENKWLFEPNRAIQYEEAVKVLTELLAIPYVETNEGEWYSPYVQGAAEKDLAISGLMPGDKITRGEMARLTAAFKVYAAGDLDDYRAAEKGISSSSSSVKSSSSSSKSSTGSSVSSSSSVSSGTGSAVYDNRTDTTIRSQMALLGEVSPILFGTKIFLTSEPMHVRTITVTLAAPASSVDAFLIYDQNRKFLGTATLQGTDYVLSLQGSALVIPKSQDFSIYGRARLSANNAGGTSGQNIQVQTVRIQGIGEWSDSSYTASSIETYSVYQSARARITKVENAGGVNGVLVGGTNQEIGNFRFTAERSDQSAHSRITALTFQIEQTGGVSLANPVIRRSGSSSTHACSLSGSNLIACTNIPESFGTMDEPAVLRLYADVTVPNGASNASLRLTLNQGGSTTQAGAIAWTDGTTVFTWVPFDTPIARGTAYSQ